MSWYWLYSQAQERATERIREAQDHRKAQLVAATSRSLTRGTNVKQEVRPATARA